MAYIKGGSVVDGNLYIEGGLVVRNIMSSSGGGKIPTVEDECARADYLIKFVNENGAIKYSTLQEHIAGTIPTLSTDATSFKFKLDGKSDKDSIVFTTKFENNKTSLDINSEPLNISVNIPSTKYAIIGGAKEIIGTEFTIDSITAETSSDAIPTEFSY